MTDYTLNLVDAIMSGKATDIESAFQEAISDKISIAMETKRTELAQGMFKESVFDDARKKQADDEKKGVDPDKEYKLRMKSAQNTQRVNKALTKEEVELYESVEIGKVHHQTYSDGSKDYFIPTEQQKNKNFKGLVFTNGKKTPKTASIRNPDLWTKTSSSEIPSHVSGHVKESFDIEDYSVEELEDFMMSEEFEQLDEEEQEILFELSQGLKDRYIKAATASKNSNTKLQKQYKASSDKHHNAGYDSYKKATSLTNKQKNFNSTLKRPQGRALQPKIDAHQAKSDHEILHRDLDHNLANHAGQQAKKREAGLKRANPNPKPSFLQRVKKKIGLGEELYLEDYSVEELEDFMMSEDFEQLDELSKKTLGSYVKKATSDVGLAGFVKGTTVNDHSRSKDYEDAATMNKKRKIGIAKAVDKLTKESIEKLDEI